jgi:hypothetical protein
MTECRDAEQRRTDKKPPYPCPDITIGEERKRLTAEAKCPWSQKDKDKDDLGAEYRRNLIAAHGTNGTSTG